MELLALLPRRIEPALDPGRALIFCPEHRCIAADEFR
jgi:hypothetical protein